MRKKIAFALTACILLSGCIMNTDTQNDHDGFFGETLNIREQVWTRHQSSRDSSTFSSIWFERFRGDRNVSNGFLHGTTHVDNGGSGAVANGLLDFSIGTPNQLELSLERTLALPFVGLLSSRYYDFKISDPEARGTRLFLNTWPWPGGGWMNRYFRDTSVVVQGTETKETDLIEQVMFIYVDRDVTVTGSGRVDDRRFTCPCRDLCVCEGSSYLCRCNGASILTLGELDLALRAGWNAVHLRFEMGVVTSESRLLRTFQSIAITLGDPSHLRWTLFGSY